MAEEQDLRQGFRDVRRLVIKIGTKSISSADGPGIDRDYLSSLASSIARLKASGVQPLLVSSGAIGMGASSLGLNQPSQSVSMRQACASIGQPLLMNEYRNAFIPQGLTPAQLLVTRDLFNDRKAFINLRNSVEKLLKMGVIPIVNENDSISTAEIGAVFGDNDQLSAHMASKIDAELLVLLSDVEGLYDSNPRTTPGASLRSYVDSLTDSHWASAGGKGSPHATGGMLTKLKAVEIAADAGCAVVLAHGREVDVLQKIMSGHEIGTLFRARPGMKPRSRWLKHSEEAGSIEIDPGALKAILERNSLLPKGIIRVDGVFPRGAVVLVNRKVKLISAFDSRELEIIAGHHSSEISELLGEGMPDVIARPEDMVTLDG